MSVSRPLSQQGQSQQTQIKMQMLESNIMRVISQNKRLQHLLEYSEHFPKLQEYTSQVALNRQKLNHLIIQINEIDHQIKKDRDAIHTNINHYYEHINKNIINQIKTYKISVNQYQEKISQIKNKQKIIVKKNFQKIKQKYVNHIKFVQGKTLNIISNAEKEFVDAFNSDITPHLIKKIQSQFQFNQINCRTEIGHIQNLMSYYHSENKLIFNTQSDTFNLQDQYNSMKIRAEEIINKNTQTIQQITCILDDKLKGIGGEINWLQNKRRKQKRINTKQSQRINSNSEEFYQNPKLIELQYEAQELQYQLMGLGRFCDKVQLRRKLLNHIKKEKGEAELQSAVTERQQKKLFGINQKLVEFRTKIKQYDSFYKHFSL